MPIFSCVFFFLHRALVPLSTDSQFRAPFPKLSFLPKKVLYGFGYWPWSLAGVIATLKPPKAASSERRSLINDLIACIQM